MQGVGRYFDGRRGARLDVAVTVQANAGLLILAHPDLPKDRESWPLEHVRALRDEARSDQVTLALRVGAADDSALIDLPRLTLTNPEMIAQIARYSPSLTKQDVASGTGAKIMARIGFASGAVALMLFVILPALAGTLAQMIPPQREAQWGRTVVAQIERFLLGGTELGDLTCSNSAGDAALDAMLARLRAGTDLAYDVQITVFDHPMVNAFAAPGGQVVLMRGLLDAASGPEDVVGVLAHEIGHVEARDATRNTLRAAGSAGLISLVLGDFAGGTLAVILAEATLSASYTRDAEMAADQFALSMLDKADISSVGLASFFEVIAQRPGGFDVPEYLSTHPNTDGRADRATAFAQAQGVTRPVLTDAEWQALRSICS